MIFDWRQAIGKAGERKVETFVEEELNFVYRKVGPPDIGVDGTIEIADKNGKSTGGMLAVQVKATKSSLKKEKSIRIPFDEDHLDYFSSLIIMPILAVVSLTDNMIWWRPILHKDNYKSLRSGYRIILNPKSDHLTKYTGRALKMLGNQSNATIAGYLIEEAEDRLAEMEENYSLDNYDGVTLDIWAQNTASILITLRDADCLLRYERRYSNDISSIEKKYNNIVHQVLDWKSNFAEFGFSSLVDEHLSVISAD